jgi:hypothetical protein
MERCYCGIAEPKCPPLIRKLFVGSNSDAVNFTSDSIK